MLRYILRVLRNQITIINMLQDIAHTSNGTEDIKQTEKLLKETEDRTTLI